MQNGTPIVLLQEIEPKPIPAYKPISSFSTWLTGTVDVSRWDSHRSLLESHGTITPERVARARDVAKRSAAIDTGAIEKLYELDRGVTITIALQSALWEAAYQNEDARTRLLIECQLDAYDFVIDFATQSVPIVEAWIRTLHERLCSAQKTYKALTPAGYQDQELKHGHYKTLDNHVRLPDGSIHAYAPADQTAMEMQRLVEEMRTPEFQTAHAVLQAAYSHHAFTCIHPFQDGNGRVARALASVFLYRAVSIPLLILVAHRDQYFNALESADKGNIQELVNFVQERSVDAFLLVNESLKASNVPSPTDATGALSRIFHTRGGYTHHEVDVAGQTLLSIFEQEIGKRTEPLGMPNQFVIGRGRSTNTFPDPPEGYRRPLSVESTLVQLNYQLTSPVRVVFAENYCFYVPRDCGVHDAIVIRCAESGVEFRAPISNILGASKAITELQMAMFVDGVLGASIQKLTGLAQQQLHDQGYL
jgi:Fic family protein